MSHFQQIFESAEVKDGMKIKEYRDNADVYHYDDLVKPLTELAKEEVAKTIDAGAPTPKLLALAVNGTKYAFMLNQITQYDKIAATLVAENKRLQAELKKLGATDGSGGKPSKQEEDSGKKAPKDFYKGSGILEARRELQEAGKIS